MEKFKVTRLGFANCSDNCVPRLYGPGPEPFDGASGDLLCRSEVVPATCIPHALQALIFARFGDLFETPKIPLLLGQKNIPSEFFLTMFGS